MGERDTGEKEREMQGRKRETERERERGGERERKKIANTTKFMVFYLVVLHSALVNLFLSFLFSLFCKYFRQLREKCNDKRNTSF